MIEMKDMPECMTFRAADAEDWKAAVPLSTAKRPDNQNNYSHECAQNVGINSSISWGIQNQEPMMQIQ